MIIQVKVIPKSSCNSIEKLDDKHYKIKITVVPEKGKANLQVIKLLAEYFKLSKSRIKIIRGTTIPDKFIEIQI
ncbi:MAG: DUF167 family protein [Patescibacteria group bacterium]